MQDYFVYGLAVTVVLAITAVVGPMINQRLGASFPVDPDEAKQVKAIFDEMGEKKVRRIKDWGTAGACVLIVIFGFVLIVPAAYMPRLMFGYLDGFVTRMPTWFTLLPLLPGICLAMALANYVTIWIAKAGFRIFFPRDSTAFLGYFGDGFSKGKNGYKVALNPKTFQLSFLKWSLIFYLVAMGVLHLTSDIISQTQLHKRGLLPFLNTAHAHEDLTYIYDEESGVLRVETKDEQTVVASAFMLGNGDIQAERQLATIKAIPSVTMVKVADNQ